MKGISVWIWVMASFIIGIVMFALSLQIVGIVTSNKSKQDGLQTFQEMSTIINSACDSLSGTAVTKTYSFPSSVSLVYTTSDVKSFAERNNRTYGNYLCVKFPDEQDCNQIKCQVEFSPVTNQTALPSVLGTLTGSIPYQQYEYTITKTNCGVSALSTGQIPTNFCSSS